MLLRLEMKDLAIVASATLVPGEGLNVLSGETGAGKSVIASALALALGERGRAEMVRTGASKATVAAEFQPDARVAVVLEKHGLPWAEPLTLRREVPGGVLVNGARAKVAVLRELAPLLVTRTGQHDQRLLLDPDQHIHLLDGFGRLDGEAMRRAFEGLVAARARLAGLRRAASRRAERDELLGVWLAELEQLAFEPDEANTLVSRRDVLRHADDLRKGLQHVEAVLYADDGAVVERLGRANTTLRRLAELDPRLESSADELSVIADRVDELVRDVRAGAAEAEADPEELDRVESRLRAARTLARKHLCDLADLDSKREELAQERIRLSAIEEDTKTAQAAVTLAEAAARTCADKLSATRRRAARRLDRELASALSRLAMPKARIQTRIEPTELSEHGGDQVELLLSANPGEEPRPLARVASGGELSRVLLALSTLRAHDVRCFLFDEVDAGMGGRTAAALAAELRALSGRVQVVCISHQASVASAADHHFSVAKAVLGGRTRTTVRQLNVDGRVDELARMLGGDVGSDAARACARQWLMGWPDRGSKVA
ncbi:MAG: DNA repair protein RecN [Proteobacteria bacterium]|nr:DNA repair protein RecN [Pseudomonadota bacterium]MCP4917530.1 DNA repair protein RecN [Pseudomonadota bacterium]